jgi:3-dehydroquinate synthase
MVFTFALPDYPILLGPLADTLPAWLAGRRYSNVLVFTDQNTQTHCLPRLRPFLPAAPGQVAIEPGERCKTLDTCQQLWQSMFAAKLDRKALVINLGGGVIGDMGGFCAATYKRGIDFIQIPTTLLAMTDAAIGGKLGIDFQEIKNTIGVFKNPVAVFVDPIFLNSLPPRELRSGFAEVIKHALIGDPELWQFIQEMPLEAFSSSAATSPEAWAELLQTSIAVKTRIVSEDPLEAGIRALLNFGHTVGHAIESYFLNTATPLTHGAAVAIGMVCESLHDPRFQKLAPLVFRIFETKHIPESAFGHLWALMQQDKKNASGAVRIAVPDANPYSMRMLEWSREVMEQSLRAYNQHTFKALSA